MRDLGSFQNKLEEIEAAEEELLLYDEAYISGVRFERSNEEDMKKIKVLKNFYENKISEILKKEITVEECERYIRLYLEAEATVLKGQEYTIDGDSMKRADLNQIRKGRIWWENKKAQLLNNTGDGIRFMQIVPTEY